MKERELELNSTFNKIQNKLNIVISKKTTLIYIAIDTLFFCLIAFKFEKEIQINFNFSEIYLFIIYSLWILGSYIFDRYTKEKKSLLRLLVTQILSSLIITLLALIFLNLLDIFILKSGYAIQYIGFLFEFLVIIIPINTSITYLFLKKLHLNNDWLYLCKERESEFLKEEIFIKNLKIITKNKEEICETNSRFIRGIIYDSNYCNYLELKSKFPNKEIFSLSEWAENFLLKYPIVNISEKNINENLFNPPNNIQKKIKRLSDLILSLILFVVFLPVIIISMVFIFLEDGAPLFYSQKRTGLNKKLFKITKLRTMKKDAERDGPQWAKANDIRITKIGAILRKYRIDELPQLISVIKGDLSLIGPRPERPEIDSLLEKKIKYYMYRYTIKPGLSGWAQVNYPYGASESDAKNKLCYDLFYLKNYSYFLDIIIFFKTIKLVFNAKGSKPY